MDEKAYSSESEEEQGAGFGDGVNYSAVGGGSAVLL